MIFIEWCFAAVQISAYFLTELMFQQGNWGNMGITPQFASVGALHILSYDALFRSFQIYHFPTGFSTEFFLKLWGNVNGTSSCLLTVDLEKKWPNSNFTALIFMLSHNCRASFPTYKLKSLLQYIFTSIITYPYNSILTVFYTMHWSVLENNLNGLLLTHLENSIRLKIITEAFDKNLKG